MKRGEQKRKDESQVQKSSGYVVFYLNLIQGNWEVDTAEGLGLLGLFKMVRWCCLSCLSSGIKFYLVS